MKHFVILIIFLFNCLFSSNIKSTDKIALVLSGGGIKGFGHIGTLHLIDSLNIFPRKNIKIPPLNVS